MPKPDNLSQHEIEGEIRRIAYQRKVLFVLGFSGAIAFSVAIALIRNNPSDEEIVMGQNNRVPMAWGFFFLFWVLISVRGLILKQRKASFESERLALRQAKEISSAIRNSNRGRDSSSRPSSPLRRVSNLSDSPHIEKAVSTSEESVSTDTINQIRKLGELQADGLITAEEFQSKRTELLGRI
jgi:hypothetical protein